MFFILWTIDVLMLDFAIESVLTHGVGGIVLFGSEYAILLASCLNSMMKYGVMVYDLHRARSRGGENAPIWENKSMYLFYIELFTGMFSRSLHIPAPPSSVSCHIENPPLTHHYHPTHDRFNQHFGTTNQ